MFEWKINDEQRITLNFSDLASAVIAQDMLEFHSRSLSDFVCRIFQNFYQSANSSIARTLLRKEDFLRSVLTVPTVSSDTCHTAIQILLKQEEAALTAAHMHHSKGGQPVNLRIQNATTEIILECQSYEGKYYPRISSYIKAIMEEYCRLPYIRREQIYFKKRFDLIASAIQTQKQLEITVQDGRRFLVHPCRILTDSLDTANYLAGFSRRLNEPINEKIPASFRIASLDTIRLQNALSKVSQKSMQFLDELITKRGIQFLLNQQTTIRVRLTDAGQFRLTRMSHLRPLCKKQEGNIFTFECTELQAEYYFISMGADCEILEPLSLRSKFADIYHAAAALYCD